jgi:hypothetical protein
VIGAQGWVQTQPFEEETNPSPNFWQIKKDLADAILKPEFVTSARRQRK